MGSHRRPKPPNRPRLAVLAATAGTPRLHAVFRRHAPLTPQTACLFRHALSRALPGRGATEAPADARTRAPAAPASSAHQAS
ncbi:hypothetical protein SipoB123_02600 [Streptomyces ipomoeae]|nr:hypothetical protein SipoB123_02600 [Streptomyces ipomoeae]